MNFITENIVLIVIAFVSGAMLLWPILQRRSGGSALDTLAATRLINDSNPIVLDVREVAEFTTGHLPNARNIPLSELDKQIGDLASGKPVLVCCATGARSARALGLLRKAGHKQVFNLAGGITAWRQAGLPVVK